MTEHRDTSNMGVMVPKGYQLARVRPFEDRPEWEGGTLLIALRSGRYGLLRGGCVEDVPQDKADEVADLPARIKHHRLAKGLRQDQLADLCGVVTGSVSQWEQGGRTPSAPSMMLLGQHIGL